MRDEILKMTGEEIEARLSAIKEELNVEDADLDSLKAEFEELKEARKIKLDNEEKRQSMLDEIAKEEVPVVEKKIDTEERKTMTVAEIRKSTEYAQAYANMIIRGDDEEVRTLLTDQVNGGSVPVPVFLEERIETAWEENKIMSLCKKSYYKGNLKVGFELSASGATVHVEGANAPNEESLAIGAVTITNQNVKKWIRLSDEVLENTTISMLDYIYDEITKQIVIKAESIIIDAITALDETATSTQVNIGVNSIETLGRSVIVDAKAKLQARAQKNAYVIMNPATQPVLWRLANPANGGKVDILAGIPEENVIYTSALKSIDEAGKDDTIIIVGDFGLGAQVNFPNGNDVKVLVDNLSEAEADLVKFVGRQNFGVGIVAPKAFTAVQLAGSTIEIEDTSNTLNISEG